MFPTSTPQTVIDLINAALTAANNSAIGNVNVANLKTQLAKATSDQVGLDNSATSAEQAAEAAVAALFIPAPAVAPPAPVAAAHA